MSASGAPGLLDDFVPAADNPVALGSQPMVSQPMVSQPMVLTRLLATMQTNIMAAALPLFNRDVDRFAVFVLVLRQSLRGSDAGTPVMALSNSLGIPFETTRRHVKALIAAGLCRRDAGGVVMTDAWLRDPPVHALLVLSHDCFVRFVEDMQEVTALPAQGRANCAYDWRTGLQAAADLMLAVAETNRAAHDDWLELVLFSTILYANYAAPSGPRRPIRVARLARILSLAKTTVQRRTLRMCGRSLEGARDGLLISEGWMASDTAQRTSAETHANMRRILAMLEAKGFPFEAPARAYCVGRPAAVPIG